MEIKNIGTCLKSIVGGDRLFNIVVPTYNGGSKLEVIINCFLSQTSKNWQLTIVSDGREPDTENIMEKYPQDNISYHHLHTRYNDWGHTPREYGIYQSESPWTILTGFDNYYVPTFLETFESISKEYPNCEFMFCDFILNHLRNGIPYNGYVNSKMEVNYIDIGNFATSTSILKEVGFKSREFVADWKLVESIIPVLKRRKSLVLKIPQTLYIHN